MIDRRTFFAIFAAPRMMMLEAIAAPRMPDRRVVLGSSQHAIFEFRSYRSRVQFEAFGITPVRRSGAKYVFAFDSLEARQFAWDRLACDPQWQKQNAHLTHLSIYRRIA